MDIKEIASKYEEYVVSMRRYFHQYPELGWEEFNTTKVIKEELNKLGISWTDYGYETGVVATLKGELPDNGKCIMLRADIDALPVEELTGAEYASQNSGVMHACGHDTHTSMLLTAVHILNDMKNEFAGTVKFIFQPAEETATGAKTMMERGCLEGVDAAFGMHIMPQMPAGKANCASGGRMAATDMFTIDVKGKGSHGAMPEEGIDAVVVAAAIINNLQSIVSRNTSPMKQLVVTVGVVDAGSRWNVVAENAHLEGTTRCLDRDIYDAIPEQFERVVKNTAAAYGAEATIFFNRFIPVTVNEEKMTALACESIKKVMGEDALVDTPPSMGGEDFSYYTSEVPASFMALGCGNKELGAVWPLHSGRFCIDESALIKGAMVHAQVALDYLANGID